jgi:DNA-binding NarL/FixJ family response regulator
VIGVIRAGARYVTKTTSGAELEDAIERVAQGDAVISPRLAGFLLDAFRADEPLGGDPELDTLTLVARAACRARRIVTEDR